MAGERLGIAGWEALVPAEYVPHSWWAPLIRWFPPGSHLLEYGAGTGNTAFALTQAGLRYKLSLVDFSSDFLMEAHRKYSMLGGPYYADFWCFDVLGEPHPDMPNGDIAFSMGLLEHFTDDEIVTILKNQSKKARTVMAAVPNARCITYQSWKKQKEDTGKWEYGHEDPKTLEQMVAYFDAAGIDVIAHMTMGDSFIDTDTDERYLLAVLGNVR